ncbi:hypothetical protein [Streptomyces sp. MNP-20]|uniref:hypothetical protein n=1 Tax=Streptomyces sp. MNP-20 TaxID=2721165 RepID=UPI001552F16A|nr:hypothetical protein [Streptomyces sp. MNP-20]
MTTPPSQAPVPPPPPYAPRPPQASPPGRSRRRGIVAVVVVALVGAGLGAWWWSKGGDDDPLAGRPWETDLKAGVSYRLPEGWKRDKGDLVDAFTSSIRTESAAEGQGEGGGGERFGMVVTGRGGAVAEPDLKAQTERAARSNAEFFNPDGSAEQTESEATTVGGHPAHTVVLVMKGGEGGETRLRLTVISADAARSVFLMGMAKPGTGAEQEAADAVLKSAKVL